MSSSNNVGFPYHPAAPPPPHVVPPPPPPPQVFPPPPSPPHVLPPPQPLPPSPSPDHHTTVVVIVFASFGGVLFLAFLATALCCFIGKKRKKSTQEMDIVHVDEHLKVKEAIVPGPYGPQALVLEIEDDLHVDEIKRKDEKVGAGASHAKLIEDMNKSIGGIEVVGEASSYSNHHPQLEHKA